MISKILKILGFQPRISNFFSQSLEHFFLTVGQNHFDNKIPFLSFQSDSGSGSIVELSDEDMDYNYVAENILTNTDHFLESKISGQFRTWHLIFFTSLGTLVAGR